MNGKRHTDRVNGTAPILDHACGNCGKTYSHRQSLHVHRMSCTPSVTEITCSPSVTDIIEELQNTLREERVKHQLEQDELRSQIHPETPPEIREVHHYHYTKEPRNNRINIKKNVKTQIVDEQENTCGDCKQNLSAFFQIDHIVALQFGGTNDKSNLMALCCECHTKKSIHENQRRKQIRVAIQTILQG
jgi:5-methylcytosine-specific restriction endonuclease McrA